MKIKKIESFLHSEGFKPEIHEEDVIVFKYQGGQYLVQLDDNDDSYVRLAFPGFWPIESEEELEQVREASITVTQRVKAAKVLPDDDEDVLATAEFWAPNQSSFEEVFYRYLDALQAATNDFAEEMRSLAAQS